MVLLRRGRYGLCDQNIQSCPSGEQIPVQTLAELFARETAPEDKISAKTYEMVESQVVKLYLACNSQSPRLVAFSKNRGTEMRRAMLGGVLEFLEALGIRHQQPGWQPTVPAKQPPGNNGDF